MLRGGRKIYLHTYLAETFIRPLCGDEVVHHKDGNPLNNELSNLEIMSRSEHMRHHKPASGYKFTDKQKAKLRLSHIGQKPWNTGKYGYKLSAAARANMSKAQKGRKITWGNTIAAAKTKVTKAQLIDYLCSNPTATLVEVKSAFNLKTHMAILKHGGLKRLKVEAKDKQKSGVFKNE